MLIDRKTAILGVAGLAAAATAPPEVAEAQTPEAVIPAERVLGIGGFFFRSKDPQALALWYQTNLGVDPIPRAYGRHGWEQTAGPTAFAPFSASTAAQYFGSPDQAFMLNFRVRNLDAMVAQLHTAGIEVKIDPQKYPNGRFARVHDPEGNPVELWEPA